jgi:drug/metabolite transporter (DMT)-like permease
MQKNIRITGIGAAVMSAFFLGLAPVFGKAAMGEGYFSPYAVVAMRTTLAAFLLFLIMALFKRQALYIYPAGLMLCAVAGSINGLGSVFYYVGLNRLNAGFAQMLYALYPFFVALWLRIMDKQSPSPLTILRGILAFASAILLTWVGIGKLDLLGVAFMLISAMFYGFHIPINQRVLLDVPAPTVAVYTLFAMSAIVVPAFFLFDGNLTVPANPPWIHVLGLTIVTFSSRLLLFTGVKHIGGMQTALLGLSELLVAVIFSHIILNEIFTVWQWIGMVGLGISLLMVWFEKPTPQPQHAHGVFSILEPPDFPKDFYKHGDIRETLSFEDLPDDPQDSDGKEETTGVKRNLTDVEEEASASNTPMGMP